MGNSVILDPFDVYRLEAGLGKGMGILMEEGAVELNVADGCILPNLKMSGQREACAFLNEQERCSIHQFRPGICRLFPLGRYYENGDFKYMLQIHECPAGNRSKVKVSKWIDTPQQEKNHAFICRWHYLLNDLEALIGNCEDETLAKQINMALLRTFYLAEYDTRRDFYGQFDERYLVFLESLDKIRESEK